MGYNLKSARDGKSMKFYDGLNFQKIKKIRMKKVVGEQDLVRNITSN